MSAEGLTVAGGWSLADRLALAGLVVAVFAIVLGLLVAHFHSAVRNEAARTRLIEKLTSQRGRDLYHEYLRGVLDWLDRTIGPPPLARHNSHGWLALGMRSLGICFFLSLTYSFAAFLTGWVAGAQGVFDQVTFLEDPYWPPPGWPPWLPRLIVALVSVAVVISALWWLRKLPEWTEVSGSWLQRRFGGLGRRVFGAAGDTALHFLGAFVPLAAAAAVVVTITIAIAVAVAGAVAGAVAIAIAGAGAIGVAVTVAIAGAVAVPVAGAIAIAVAVAGAAAGAVAIGSYLLGADPELALITMMFLAVLPLLNGLLDWISLSVSRWLGRGIVAEWDSPARLGATLFFAILDLMLAVAFAFIVAWLLAFGIEAVAGFFQLSLGLDRYVSDAAAAPWTTGFWASFMVLSTLFPTAIHLVLACGAVLVAWPSNPLRAWAAARLECGTEADWLLPRLYLTFGWLIPTFLVPAALLWGLMLAFDLIWVESLPEALRDTALSAIGTARTLW